MGYILGKIKERQSMGGLATAWYLGLDLWIVDCKSRDDKPFIQVSGNLDNAEESCNGPIITLGTKSSCHYQSLLPTEIFHLEFTKNVNPDIMSMPSAKNININPLDVINEVKIEGSKIQSKKDSNTISGTSLSNNAEQIIAESSTNIASLEERSQGRKTRSSQQHSKEDETPGLTKKKIK